MSEALFGLCLEAKMSLVMDEEGKEVARVFVGRLAKRLISQSAAMRRHFHFVV